MNTWAKSHSYLADLPSKGRAVQFPGEAPVNLPILARSFPG